MPTEEPIFRYIPFIIFVISNPSRQYIHSMQNTLGAAILWNSAYTKGIVKILYLVGVRVPPSTLTNKFISNIHFYGTKIA